MTGVFLLDREPSDPTVGLPPGDIASTDTTVNLVDRDGNRYVGELVKRAEGHTEAVAFVRAALRSWKLPDGRDIPDHSLVILELAKRPRAGHPLKFVE